MAPARSGSGSGSGSVRIRLRLRLQSHHFHTVSAIDHSKSRSQGNNISLPPITKLTLFYLVLHICSYKYVQPNLFVVFCIESIQNTTKLLCLAFPKKR